MQHAGLRLRAVVAPHKGADQTVRVRIRVPEQPAQQINTQRRKGAGFPGGVVALLQHPLHAEATEQTQVFPDHMPVGEGLQIIAEIGGVIPQVQMGRNFGPVGQIVGEGLSGQGKPVGGVVLHVDAVDGLTAHGHGMALTALDAAQPDDHVFPGPEIPGRFPGIQIGEGVNAVFREFRPDSVRHGVDEGKHGSGVAFLPPIYGLAMLALAVAVPVVLGHGENAALRVLPHPAVHSFDADFQHVRVGQAELAMLPPAFSVHQREIFRVGIKPFFRGNQLLKGMGIAIEADFAAHFRRNLRPGGVQPALQGEPPVQRTPPVQIPIGEIGPGGKAHGLPLRDGRQNFTVLSQKLRPQPLQQGVYAVDRRPGAFALNIGMTSSHGHAVALAPAVPGGHGEGIPLRAKLRAGHGGQAAAELGLGEGHIAGDKDGLGKAHGKTPFFWLNR